MKMKFHLNIRFEDDRAVAVEHGQAVVAVVLGDGQRFPSEGLEKSLPDVGRLQLLL